MKISKVGHVSIRLKMLGLLLITLVIIASTFITSTFASAQTKSGSVNVNALVKGPPPTTAATIDIPKDGEIFHNIPITVTGSCPSEGLIIKIIDNGKFAGSTTCNSNGGYFITIDLFLGTNRLVAREQDIFNQYGPDSVPVNVSYIKSNSNTEDNGGQPPASTGSGIAKLTIVMDPRYISIINCQAGQILGIPLRITGGKAPYAVHINWGDGKDSLISQDNTDSFVLTHNYAKCGTYNATIQASDSSGQEAILQIAIIIKDKTAAIIPRDVVISSKLTFLWWLSPLVALLLLLAGYWFGARRHRKSKDDHIGIFVK